MGDLNADGWDDIFIASGMSYPYRYGINSLLLNDRGKKFDDAEFVLESNRARVSTHRGSKSTVLTRKSGQRRKNWTAKSGRTERQIGRHGAALQPIFGRIRFG